jgi:hypothetical protein
VCSSDLDFHVPLHRKIGDLGLTSGGESQERANQKEPPAEMKLYWKKHARKLAGPAAAGNEIQGGPRSARRQFMKVKGTTSGVLALLFTAKHLDSSHRPLRHSAS